ncbi:MAG: hypothetical protein L0210_12725 [Rhodospirillales bacterium]|nr:hypothetical protein [Rhodospirillales bacterium]
MPSNSNLWQRIQGFEIDNPNDELPFSSRLARENCWSHEKARDAIEQYKKFIYLVCVAASRLTPSEVVRQVWRLHLVDTRSYWTEFCEGVLGRPIHHEPTEGGGACAYRYAETRSLYADEFACQPPAEFWPRASERFAAAPSRQEIVRNSGWIAPAPSGYGSILWCAGATLLAVMASGEGAAAAVQPATASNSSLGPMLVLAGVVTLVALIARGLRRIPRGDAGKERSAGGYRRGDSGGYWGCEG